MVSLQKQFEESLDIILFLTDGTPSDSHTDIMSEIQKGQELMVKFSQRNFNAKHMYNSTS